MHWDTQIKGRVPIPNRGLIRMTSKQSMAFGLSIFRTQQEKPLFTVHLAAMSQALYFYYFTSLSEKLRGIGLILIHVVDGKSKAQEGSILFAELAQLMRGRATAQAWCSDPTAPARTSGHHLHPARPRLEGLICTHIHNPRQT